MMALLSSLRSFFNLYKTQLIDLLFLRISIWCHALIMYSVLIIFNQTYQSLKITQLII